MKIEEIISGQNTFIRWYKYTDGRGNHTDKFRAPSLNKAPSTGDTGYLSAWAKQHEGAAWMYQIRNQDGEVLVQNGVIGPQEKAEVARFEKELEHKTL